jgi:acetyl-CoA carboxylase/biotin carboxylase 1
LIKYSLISDSQLLVFVRGISGTKGITTVEGAERALLQGLDELERAQSSSKVDSVQSSSRIYLHSIPPLEDTTPEELSRQFKEIIGVLKSRHANRLLKLRVDEIEVLLRRETEDTNGETMVERIRFLSSSLEGEWMKTKGYSEVFDPETGAVYESCITDDDDDYCLLDYYEASNDVQSKRALARKVGSTYAYDFLGLLEVGLLGQWGAHLKALSVAGKIHEVKDIPSTYFHAKELIEGKDGQLIIGSRPIATNKVGMVAWDVKMKTPEYPEGREVVLIANDVTVKSGSFSVAEDEVYYKASEYARKRNIPRVYISCNAGARIGLYEDLKSKLKLKLHDTSAPSKGFDYLYISDEDYEALPEGAVLAHKVEEGWALDDIIGTTFGIGVENLQGSGKIAGETSQAYHDVFTLSYVTGRSVGIGAYLVRLGQRIIQKSQGPIILTGYSALNKLLGREVYSSQDQLGGKDSSIYLRHAFNLQT